MNDTTLGRSYKDGEVIIQQGEIGDCMFVIQQGKVEVMSESGDQVIKIAELGASEFFGEMGLFEKSERSCTVKAIGDAKIMTIDKKNLYKIIHKDPVLVYRLLEKMSGRLRETNKKLHFL